MAETGIDDDRYLCLGKLVHESEYGFVELLQTRGTATLSRQIAAVNDDMIRDRASANFGLRGYHETKVESMSSVSSWSCTALLPVAGLPDSTRDTWRRS